MSCGFQKERKNRQKALTLTEIQRLHLVYSLSGYPQFPFQTHAAPSVERWPGPDILLFDPTRQAARSMGTAHDHLLRTDHCL